MSWDRTSDALAEVFLTVQRILLPWVSVSKQKASQLINDSKFEEACTAEVAALIKDLSEYKDLKSVIAFIAEQKKAAEGRDTNERC